MNITLRIILLGIFSFFSFVTFAQNESAKGDAALERLYNQQNFYLSQLKKEYISDTLKYTYRIKLQELEKQISEQYERNLKRLQNFPNTEQLIQDEKNKKEYRAIELEMLTDSKPNVYAHEMATWSVYGGIGLGSLNYSLPISLGFEKVLNEKISVGLLYQRFSENIKVKEYDDSLSSYIIYTSRYKYYYNSVNARISYHMMISSLNPERFDLYTSALLGYNLASQPKTIIEAEDDISDPSSKGINYGINAGLKYMVDKNFGFYSELGYSRNVFFTLGGVYRIVPGSKEKVEKVNVAKEEDIEEENADEEDTVEEEKDNKGKKSKKAEKKKKAEKVENESTNEEEAPLEEILEEIDAPALDEKPEENN